MLASPSDMIPVRDHVHFLFCEEVNIVSPGLQFNGYVFSGDLKIDQTQTSHSSQKTALFLEENSYDYLAFYLLEKSTVNLKHCSELLLTFTVIIGRENFEIWKRNQYCDNCFFDQSILVPLESCKDENRFGRYSLEALTGDEYFIIYSNDNLEGDWVDMTIEVDHTIYDMQNATTSCTDATQCNIILNGPGDTAVIWVMNYNYDLGQYNHPEFSVKCVPRIWAYLLIHGFPILLIGVCISILIQRTCRDPNDRSFNIQSERTPLLYGTTVLPPSYSAVFSQPPKYEDIVQTCEPPPYSEVLESLETGRNYPVSSTNSSTHNERNIHGITYSVSAQNESNERLTRFSIINNEMTSRSDTEEHEEQTTQQSVT